MPKGILLKVHAKGVLVHNSELGSSSSICQYESLKSVVNTFMPSLATTSSKVGIWNCSCECFFKSFGLVTSDESFFQ